MTTKNYPDRVDLFCELQSFRNISNNCECYEQAYKLYNETGNLDKVDEFCKSLFLADQAERLLKESKINKRFISCTFEQYEAKTEVQKTALLKAKEFIENIKENLEQGCNLIFAGYGCVGTGKTHLANAVARELMVKKGVPCKFINVISLVADLKEKFNINEYTDVAVLIIDDLGKEKGTQWVCEQIYAIINKRYEQMKPTIITTENELNTLKNNYDEKGKAIISRLCENFILVKLTGEDYRLSEK